MSKDGTAKKQRSSDEVERDRVEIARRYLMGETQRSIGLSLGVTQQQISLDMKVIRDRWKASALRNFDELKSQELAKIDQLEAEYWEIWRQTLTTKETVVDESGGNVDDRSGNKRDLWNKTSTKREKLLGNPAYLAGIQGCINKRCQLLGLDAPLVTQVESEATLTIKYANEPGNQPNVASDSDLAASSQI